MPERVRITDVSPRDGLQNEPGIIPTAEKVRLVELLAASGVDEVEVTSFVSPKWVPQLGDAQEVLSGLFPKLPLPEGGGRGEGSSPPALQGSAFPSFRSPQQRPHPPRLNRAQALAQHLRSNTTWPEQAVWSQVRDRRLHGYRFRRQHPFGPYILDFFCASHGLAVELDGRSHALSRSDDAARTAYIESFGVHVIRFSDDLVVQSPTSVSRSIHWALRMIEGTPPNERVARLQSLRQSQPSPQPPPSGRGGIGERQITPLYSALVPNAQGMNGAIDAISRAGFNLIRKVSVFTAASESFSKRNTNASIAETIERFKPVVAIAHDNDLDVRGYVSCVIACPFEGPILPEKSADVCHQLIDLGVDELDLGDTIGAATPDSVAKLLAHLARYLPSKWSEGFATTLHLHDTFGRAAECVKAALDMGIRSFDGSVAGLGGCPYASTPGKRAPGNISTETLVRTIHDAGFETGVNLDRLAEAADFARKIVSDARLRASTDSAS